MLVRSRPAASGVEAVSTARRRLGTPGSAADCRADKVDRASPQAESGRGTVLLLDFGLTEQILVSKRSFVCLRPIKRRRHGGRRRRI